MPIVLPNEAPIAIDGTKMPAGTLHPYEIITRNVRTNVEKINDNTIRHRFFALDVYQYMIFTLGSHSLLAKAIIIVSAFTF